MNERPTREAPMETFLKVQEAFKKRYVESDSWYEPLMADIEEILGPFDKSNVVDFSVRFTKLQAEPDGVHEYVTLYF
jgi:hypothetical protein